MSLFEFNNKNETMADEAAISLQYEYKAVWIKHLWYLILAYNINKYIYLNVLYFYYYLVALLSYNRSFFSSDNCNYLIFESISSIYLKKILIFLKNQN